MTRAPCGSKMMFRAAATTLGFHDLPDTAFHVGFPDSDTSAWNATIAESAVPFATLTYRYRRFDGSEIVPTTNAAVPPTVESTAFSAKVSELTVKVPADASVVAELNSPVAVTCAVVTATVRSLRSLENETFNPVAVNDEIARFCNAVFVVL